MKDTTEFVIKFPTAVEYEAVRILRHDVLDPAKVKPTELSISDKDKDPDCILVAAFIGAVAISTVRLDKIDSTTYLVRKMATSESFQGQGIGGKVLEYAEDEAVKRGAETIILDSRENAIPFYEQHGYELTGEVVMHNDGIPNFSMTKEIA